MARQGGYKARRKPRWGMLALIAALHVLAIIGLARAFAPNLTASAIDAVESTLTVIVATPDEPEAPPSPSPDEGAAGEAGDRATPRPTSAPEARVPRDEPAPRASSTGADNRSGASAGEGTGGANEGAGTGSGNDGIGLGAGCPISSKPTKIAGDINSASDYGVPPGGRQARFGTSVTIAITVGREGRPTACRVHAPGPFPETNARTCELAMQRFRFCPATDRSGNPVVSTFGWRQDFRSAR